MAHAKASRFVFLAFMTIVVAACSGGGQSAVPQGPSAVSAPTTTGTDSHSKQTQSVTITVTIPTATTSSTTRRTLYVSQSTKSMVVTATLSSGSGRSSNATANCSGTTCTASVSAPIGTDTFSVSLYDGLNGTGNVLSTGSTTTAIVAQQPTTLSLTFNGVVSKLALAPNPSTLALGTAATAAVTVTAQDADGNTIIGSDPYASPITLSSSDTSGATQLSTTSVTSPASTVSIAYNGSKTVSSPVTVTATSGSLRATTQLTISSSTASPPPASPSPVASSAPSSPPSTGGLASPANEWPASFTPYATSSVWNTMLPAQPTLYQNSDNIIALYQTGITPGIHTQECCSGYDVSHPIYFASTSDPVVTAHCNQYCGNFNNGSSSDYTLHIPARARPASGDDHHMAVVQPDGTEDDFWEVTYPSSNWSTGQTLTAGGGAHCGNFYTGPGLIAGGATAGGNCLAAGLVRAAELQAGAINHALFLVAGGGTCNSFVFPASNSDGGNTNANCAPMGSHLWLDIPDATIQAMGITSWEKAIMIAMHDHGGYVMDNGAPNGLFNPMMEDNAQFVAMGTSPIPTDTWAAGAGWYGVTINPSGSPWTASTRYIANPSWGGINWQAHLHIVAPCYAQKTC